MKILFLCTAHNSLSQRLCSALSRAHDITLEYALSEDVMISAVALAQPDIIICPFLTILVPRQIYEEYLTLIIHPGPPGDVGPSALDWVLIGDDGSTDDAHTLLKKLDTEPCSPGRTHWGVTVLQAIKDFDAGPVWAFDQFELDIDQPGLTKSALYHGAITQSALNATLTAISRVKTAASCNGVDSLRKYPPTLPADPKYGLLSTTSDLPWQGGKLHRRPLLKAAQREFDACRHNAQQISRRIRCSDSQPGVLSKVFGSNLYVYGGQVEDNADERFPTFVGEMPTAILGIRNQAVCICACDGKGVWITHVRRPKAKTDSALWPKVTATTCLLELGLLTASDVHALNWSLPLGWKLSVSRTFQEVWVDMQVDTNQKKIAYLYFDFYNGAMATDQCSYLIEAMDFIIHESTDESPVQAVVLMGGAYFSNGIALNVIEAAADPACESWLNINRINDVVHYLLHDFPSRGIVTVAALRGNAAAGGCALAAACDVVVAGHGVVLNPAYRAIGLFGSEYHTLSYYGRCGKVNADNILHAMTPISVMYAQSIGLVDYIFPGTGQVLEDYVRTHIAFLLNPGILKRGPWKKNVDLSASALARARAHELGEMSRDFWSARSTRYHTRRFDFVRKVKASQTPLRFATHRRGTDPLTPMDEEESNDFDSVDYFQRLAVADLRKQLADEMSETTTTHLSFATPVEAVTSAPSVRAKKNEIMFSCYYKPQAVDLPTPPESPLVGVVEGSEMPLITTQIAEHASWKDNEMQGLPLLFR